MTTEQTQAQPKTRHSEVRSDALLDASRELARALDFYDRVQTSSEDERIAVGRDHYDWVFRAARKVASASNASASISSDEPEYAPRTCSIEGYPKDWVRVTLAVSPGAKEIHALGGDREGGDGDTPYIGYERILNRLQSNAENQALTRERQ